MSSHFIFLSLLFLLTIIYSFNVSTAKHAFHSCVDQEFIDFGDCPQFLGYGIKGKICVKINGCSSPMNLRLFRSISECKKICKSNSVHELPPLCTKPSSACCPDGRVADVCVMENVNEYKHHMKCNNVRPQTIIVDPCNKCKAEFIDINGDPIPSTDCHLELPEYHFCNPYSEVKCPPFKDRPYCGSPPSDCPHDWLIRCVYDPCTCQPVWMNEDIRRPSKICMKSLGIKCVMSSDCPNDFRCLNKAEAMAQRKIKNGYDLMCIQEDCTCAPIWYLYKISDGLPFLPGVKAQCSDQRECCPGKKYKPKNCTKIMKRGQELCKTIKCQGLSLDRHSCSMNPCDDCNLQIKTETGRPVNMSLCSIVTKQLKTCPFDHKIKCDPTILVDCGPFPDSCPRDWNIFCIMDPCTCKPRWHNVDHRHISVECSKSLFPQL